MPDPLDQAWQKWQRVGSLTSGRVSENKHRLFGPLLHEIVPNRKNLHTTKFLFNIYGFMFI